MRPVGIACLAASLLAFVNLAAAASAAADSEPFTGQISVEEARAIAGEAYLYAFPAVENYLSIYQFAIDSQGTQFKGPPNAIHNVPRVFTPEDTGVVTPNSDTPYSFLVMDLRSEPLVVTLPAVEPERYYSLQLVDLYTHNVDYLGTRKDGNNGGDFLIAGPGWSGAAPEGVKRVVRMPTWLVYSQFRTQLYDEQDLDRVIEIQAGYAVQPLSRYLGEAAPTPAPEIEWPAISRNDIQAHFWNYANFLLQFAPPLPWETALRARFKRIGVTAGEPWPPESMPDSIRDAVREAGRDKHAEIASALLQVTSSSGLFGTPEAMRGKLLARAIGAMGGLYGNTDEEATYPSYLLDNQGRPLDASKFDYIMRLTPDTLPPVDAFWSITMYHGDTRFLVDNPLDRYLINSSMLAQLEADAAGEIVLYLQHENPGRSRENNWLPAPDGPMGVVMRLYLPGEQALNGEWQPPPIEISRQRTGSRDTP